MVAWTTVFVLGAAQAISNRFYMNPDGVSYLDLSDAYAKGDWAAAANGYWSPLYPALLGQIRRVHDWVPYWEAPAVHAVNLGIYLVSFAAFSFMLREFQYLQRDRRMVLPNLPILELRSPLEKALACALFLWGALSLISVTAVTPDMLIAAEVYLIAAIMIRSVRPPARWVHPIVLGGVLGISYLTKAVMFPVAFLVIIFAGWGAGTARWTLNKRFACLAMFLLISAPQIINVSRKVGHFSFGENGKLAYATYVNQYPLFWTGEPPGSGRPEHPAKRILSDPEGFAFPGASPGATYPFWFDPSHWEAGIRPHFDFGQQGAAIKKQALIYASIFTLLIFAGVVLTLMAVRPATPLFLSLSVPAIGVFLLYGLVYAEPRYLAPSAVVLFLFWICSLGFSNDASARRDVRAVLAAITVWRLLGLATSFHGEVKEVGRIAAGRGHPHESWMIARSIAELGLLPGQRVAFIGWSFDAYWARLAKVQIAMEIPEPAAGKYWLLPDSERIRISQVFADHGATQIVSKTIPPGFGGPGWLPLPFSYNALPLRPTTRY